MSIKKMRNQGILVQCFGDLILVFQTTHKYKSLSSRLKVTVKQGNLLNVQQSAHFSGRYFFVQRE